MSSILSLLLLPLCCPLPPIAPSQCPLLPAAARCCHLRSQPTRAVRVSTAPGTLRTTQRRHACPLPPPAAPMLLSAAICCHLMQHNGGTHVRVQAFVGGPHLLEAEERALLDLRTPRNRCVRHQEPQNDGDCEHVLKCLKTGRSDGWVGATGKRDCLHREETERMDQSHGTAWPTVQPKMGHSDAAQRWGGIKRTSMNKRWRAAACCWYSGAINMSCLKTGRSDAAQMVGTIGKKKVTPLGENRTHVDEQARPCVGQGGVHRCRRGGRSQHVAWQHANSRSAHWHAARVVLDLITPGWRPAFENACWSARQRATGRPTTTGPNAVVSPPH